MKKILSNKNFIQKILISMIIVVLCTFAIPTRSQAGIGGILLNPIVDLLGTIADVFPGALQAFLVDGNFNNANSDDNGLLNLFMVKHGNFNATDYPDFTHSTSNHEAQVPIDKDELDKDYYIPVLKYTPEKIFSGLVPALDINFVNPRVWETDEMNERSVAQQLHETIAKWYVALRNLAIVGLMLVLVYVGIRMVISSTASDKSKYKQMLMDWLIALCLLFVLHYIMTFTTTIVTEISQAINETSAGNGNNIAVTVSDGTQFNTDMMGLIRFRMQSPNGWYKLLYLIFYLAMVIYTCMFTFYYLKRVLTMAFLTLISPLVALTYPIDKLRDGKAQAFDMWLKEYTFNALLQPFHLIIYSIFVGAAIDLVAVNPIFAIIALAFLTPAEKILRKFFGFEKASTAGALGGFAGGATAMHLAQRLLGPSKGAKGGSGAKGNNNIRTRQRPEGDVGTLAEGLGGASNAGSDTTQIREAENNNTNSDTQNDTAMPQNTSPTGIESGTNIASSPTNAFGASLDNDDYLDYQMGNYDFVDTQAEPIPTPSNDTATQNNSGTHGRGAFAWSDNDTRGMGAYLGDVAKYGANKLGTWAAGTGVGKQAIRFGTAAKGTAHALADKANKVTRKIPKPIRNTAKGVGKLALNTGVAVGKGALRTAGRVASAAPGAIFGMAAGIAGDELKDIPTYTAAGAALTSTMGYNAIGRAATSAGSFVASSYRQGAYGSDEAIIAQAEKEYAKSKEWDDVYQHEFKHDDGSKLSRAELKNRKQQGAFYAARGITGDDTIKAVKLEDKIKKEIGPDNENLDAQQYTARIMKIAKPYSADMLRKDSEVRNLTTSIEKELMKGGFDQRNASDQAKIAVKYIKQAKGIKDE